MSAPPSEASSRSISADPGSGGGALPGHPRGWRWPTALAPLEGVGHPVFRRLVAEPGGVGLVCAGFVSVGVAPPSPEVIRSHVAPVEGLPLSVQLLGLDPERMAAAARVLAEAGAQVVDVNLGCPARRVVGRGAGAGLLSDPDAIHRLLCRIRGVVEGVLSAKVRAGLDDPRQGIAAAEAAQAAGADFIAVHPRLAVDGYRGEADWSMIALMKSRLTLPVVGNGDCWYASDVLRMEALTGCDAVMIGRGAIRNPWIFRQVDALRRGLAAPEPRGADVARFLERAMASYREALGGAGRPLAGKIKEIVRYLGSAVEDGGRFRQAALRAPTAEAIGELAWELLGPLPPAKLDLSARPLPGRRRPGSVEPQGG